MSYVLKPIGAAVALVMIAGSTVAAPLEITITNVAPAGGIYFTPVIGSFHDGSFDQFDAGSAASPGVVEIAEEGSPATFIADAPAGVQVNPLFGPGAPPVFAPGETATATVDVDDSGDLYFSFLSMIIPSNDNFIGNDNPLAYQLFDAGSFVGTTISIFAGDIWDAGSEVNDNLGAAFNSAGGMGTDENGVITLQGNIDQVLGEGTAVGTTILSVPNADDLIATITFAEAAPVPLPAGGALLLAGLAGFGVLRRSR